jgi:hypothetical protein
MSLANRYDASGGVDSVDPGCSFRSEDEEEEEGTRYF